MTTVAKDYLGYRYSVEVPSFVIASNKLYFHRPSERMLDRGSVDNSMVEDGYSPGANEIGFAEEWLWEYLTMGTPQNTSAFINIDEIPSNVPAGSIFDITLVINGGNISISWTAPSDMTQSEAVEAIIDAISAEDLVDSVVISGGSIVVVTLPPNYITGADLNGPNAPTLVVVTGLTSNTRILNIIPTATGTPDPTVTLTVLELDGVDVLSSAQGTGPWTYAVPETHMNSQVFWEVVASNTGGTVVRSALEYIASGPAPYTNNPDPEGALPPEAVPIVVDLSGIPDPVADGTVITISWTANDTAQEITYTASGDTDRDTVLAAIAADAEAFSYIASAVLDGTDLTLTPNAGVTLANLDIDIVIPVTSTQIVVDGSAISDPTPDGTVVDLDFTVDGSPVNIEITISGETSQADVLAALAAEAVLNASIASATVDGTDLILTSVIDVVLADGVITVDEPVITIPDSLFEDGEQGGFYDLTDISNLYQDSAMTTAVTGYGDPVGAVLDSSGNGNHLIQDTAAGQPIYTRHPKTGVTNIVDNSNTPSNWGQDGITVTSVDDWTRGETADATINSRFRNAIGTLTADVQHFMYVEIRNGDDDATTRIGPFNSGYTWAYVDLTWASGVPSVSAYRTEIITDLQVTALTDGSGGYAVSCFFTPLDDAAVSQMHLYPNRSGVDGVGAEFRNSMLAEVITADIAVPEQIRVSAYDVTEAGVADWLGITYDGVDDYLVTSADVDFTHTNKMSAAAAATLVDNDTYGQAIMAVNGSSSPRWRFGVASITSMQGQGDLGSLSTASSSGRDLSVPHIHGMYVDGDSSIVQLYEDNVAVGQSTSDMGTGTFPSAPIYVGARQNIVQFLSGTIYNGVVVVDRVLSTAERNALNDWLDV